MTIAELIKASHEMSASKGFWSGRWGSPPEARIPETLALIHSEISEALEAYRELRDDWMYHVDENGKPEGFSIELADAVIRIADLCGALGIDLEKAIEEKQAYNATRPHKHGKRL